MIAIVPLIVFISGFFMSMSIPVLNKYINNNAIYLIGTALCISGFIWARDLATPIGSVDPSRKYEIIGIAIVSLFFTDIFYL